MERVVLTTMKYINDSFFWGKDSVDGGEIGEEGCNHCCRKRSSLVLDATQHSMNGSSSPA